MIGEDLSCEREPLNLVDRYAIVVLKDDTIVGHIPKKISRICVLFIVRGGTIVCTPMGGRRYIFHALKILVKVYFVWLNFVQQ